MTVSKEYVRQHPDWKPDPKDDAYNGVPPAAYGRIAAQVDAAMAGEYDTEAPCPGCEEDVTFRANAYGSIVVCKCGQASKVDADEGGFCLARARP